MAYRNPELLSQLPAPVLSLGSGQLAIRGRDLNVWLSEKPNTSLLFSLALRTQLPADRLIFTQYLATLALVEACRDNSVLGPEAGANVKIKWPTNVFVFDKTGNWRKVGGVLVTKVDRAEGADLIIGEQTTMPFLINSLPPLCAGCGMSLNSPAPFTSIASLLPSKPVITERTVAAVLAKFESLWIDFVAQDGLSEPFMRRYMDHWLHSFVPPIPLSLC